MLRWERSAKKGWMVRKGTGDHTERLGMDKGTLWSCGISSFRSKYQQNVCQKTKFVL